jgi:DNA-directed RNA polymerase specialized sigma24 family protein
VGKRDEKSWALTTRLYLEGFSLQQVADMAYVAPTTVRDRLVAQGIPLRPPGPASGGGPRLSTEDIDKTVFMYVNMEMSAGRISEALGISTSTVMYRIHKAGVARTLEQQQELAMRTYRRRRAAFAQ